jgi:hypothetical protein
MKRYILILLIFTVVQPVKTHANEEFGYGWKEIKRDWSAPLTQKGAHPTLFTGTAITSVLVIFRKGLVDPGQKQVAEDEPLGEWANFGDTMGQMVPNVLYMGAMWAHYKFSNNQTSKDRTIFMLKTSAYAGLTTGILKRIVNQKRPHGGDRLSFPSGHTTTAFAFASVVGLEHEWYWGVGAYTIAGIVGYSRMNDNAHYLHDVVFGATLGISYGIAFYHQDRQLEQHAFFYPLIQEDKVGLGWVKAF